MRGGLGRRVAMLEQRLGAVSYDSWTDCQLVERINAIAGMFRAAGLDVPSLDPDRPDPAMLDGFIARMKLALPKIRNK